MVELNSELKPEAAFQAPQDPQPEFDSVLWGNLVFAVVNSFSAHLQVEYKVCLRKVLVLSIYLASYLSALFKKPVLGFTF